MIVQMSSSCYFHNSYPGWNISCCHDGGALCDETKILTDTETETFYPRQIFPIPIPRLFFRDQIFRDRYRDFFSETKFSNTDTETFLTRPNFSIPIPRLFFETKSFDNDTETLKKIVMGLETETETETFRDIYRQFLATFAHFFVEIFFSETKFSETETETFF